MKEKSRLVRMNGADGEHVSGSAPRRFEHALFEHGMACVEIRVALTRGKYVNGAVGGRKKATAFPTYLPPVIRSFTIKLLVCTYLGMIRRKYMPLVARFTQKLNMQPTAMALIRTDLVSEREVPRGAAIHANRSEARRIK